MHSVGNQHRTYHSLKCKVNLGEKNLQTLLNLLSGDHTEASFGLQVLAGYNINNVEGGSSSCERIKHFGRKIPIEFYILPWLIVMMY